MSARGEAEERAWASAFGTVWVLTGNMANRAARRAWCKHVADDAVEAYRETHVHPEPSPRASASDYPPGFPDPTKPIPDSEIEALFQHSDTWDKPGGKKRP